MTTPLPKVKKYYGFKTTSNKTLNYKILKLNYRKHAFIIVHITQHVIKCRQNTILVVFTFLISSSFK